MRFHELIIPKDRNTELKHLPIERKTIAGDGDQLGGGQGIRRADLVWPLFCNYTRSRLDSSALFLPPHSLPGPPLRNVLAT